MKASSFIAAASVAALLATSAAAPITVRIQRDAGRVRVIFDTERACTYQLKLSTNLHTWEDYGTTIAGNGLVNTQELAEVEAPRAFFGLSMTETSQVLSPDEWTFADLVVGKLLFSYEMVSETRFSWFGETGEWGYLSFGDETAWLVFTYDEDDNNRDLYREEVLLTFESETQGTYRYSEFYRNVENPTSVAIGRFDLSTLAKPAG